MASRRGFLAALSAALAAPFVAAHAGDPRRRSDAGVPPRMDVREGDNPTVPIVVKRHGIEMDYVVAYDIDADSVTIYRVDNKGVPLIGVGCFEYETLRGGVTVHWVEKGASVSRPSRR